MVKLQVFKANEGDSMLLSFDDNNKHILIDMGTIDTYSHQIKKELLKIAAQKECINLLVITHIDNDHIGGAIPFLIENSKDEKLVDIEEIWFNSYKHLHFSKPYISEIPNYERSILKQIKACNKYQDFSDETRTSPIGVKEGTTFSNMITKNGYNWNNLFDGNAVCIENHNFIDLGHDISIYLLSPNKSKLDKLAKYWLKFLETHNDDFHISQEGIFDDAFELYLKDEEEQEIEIRDTSTSKEKSLEELQNFEQKDSSQTNGSSIAFILQHKKTKILFLGDAHEDNIYTGLVKLKETGYTLSFDLVKLSHHGSNRNITKRLIYLIQSKKFLISTNGNKYSHPSIEAIAKIILKKTPFKKTLIFNYEIVSIFKMLKKYQHIYNFEIKIQNEIYL